MTHNQNRLLSLTLAGLAGAGVLWYLWPANILHPANSATSLEAKANSLPNTLGDAQTVARVKAALGRPDLIPATTAPSLDPTTGLQRKPHPAPQPHQTLQMTIKELGNFDYDPVQGGSLPPDIKALDSCQIRLLGYMWPLGQADKLTDFILVPSLTSCCFGQPPGVQHIVTTRLPANKTVPFVVDQVWVEGTLHVKIIREEDYTSSIFEMDATSVQRAE